MASGGSNYNSMGAPVDHEGAPLENFGFLDGFNQNPFLISGIVLQEILTDNTPYVEDFQHSEAGLFEGYGMESASGGIPLERSNSASSEEILSPRSARIQVDAQENARNLGGARENALLTAEESSQAVKAVFSISKLEREELTLTRSRVNDLNNFILRNGLKIDDVDEFLRKDGFLKPRIERDENGLPFLNNNLVPKAGGPLKGILKPVRGSVIGAQNLAGVSGVKDTKGMEGQSCESGTVTSKVILGTEDGKKSWAAVLQSKEAVRVPPVVFDFTPPPLGSSVVDPLDDLLQEGIEKMKNCFTGHFSRGTISYSLMNSEAHKAWGKKGLAKVSQKDANTFIFRFNSTKEKDSILTRGTWYFARKPMVVMDCCPVSISSTKVTKMPIWVKLSNVPDAYWTRDLLGRVVSVIGKPLFADNLTAQLDILPFARFCVEYSIGTPLPDSIDVMVKDPISGEKASEKISVHYLSKPQTCTVCLSLGHTDSVCPASKARHTKPAAKTSSVKLIPVDTPFPEQKQGVDSAVAGVPVLRNEAKPEVAIDNVEADWQTVKQKSRDKRPMDSPISDIGSPSPNCTFKSLKIVDEVDQKLNKESKPGKQKLSKSALKKLKKLRRNSGTASPGTE